MTPNFNNSPTLRWLHTTSFKAILRIDNQQHSTPFAFPRQRFECLDGFCMSIQASNFFYCHPKKDVAHWSHVELGALSCPEPLIERWAESLTSEKAFYPYVPIQIVDLVLKTHTAAGLLLIEDHDTMVFYDFLREEDLIQAKDTDPNEWSMRDRVLFAQKLELFLAFWKAKNNSFSTLGISC